MTSIANIFLIVFDAIVQFYYWLAILHVILSWLIGFNIINPSSRITARLIDMVNYILMPIYDWIYQFLRPIGGGIIAMFDLRPLLFLLFLYLFKPMVHAMVWQLVSFF
ncbi:MAG: YggT family protein [Alphaproteobacteria bacterium]